jgi:hypothetical protein
MARIWLHAGAKTIGSRRCTCPLSDWTERPYWADVAVQPCRPRQSCAFRRCRCDFHCPSRDTPDVTPPAGLANSAAVRAMSGSVRTVGAANACYIHRPRRAGSKYRRDQCPIGWYQFGSSTMQLGLNPSFFRVSMLPIRSPFCISMTVIEPSLMPGRLSSAFWT